MPHKVDKREKSNKTHARKASKERLVFLIYTVVISLFVLTFYRLALRSSFSLAVMWIYMIIFAALILVYIIYNRGFSRAGMTEDMLPEEWESAKRKEYIDNAERRFKRSKVILSFIIAFVVTYLIDSLELFVFPVIGGWF